MQKYIILKRNEIKAKDEQLMFTDLKKLNRFNNSY